MRFGFAAHVVLCACGFQSSIRSTDAPIGQTDASIDGTMDDSPIFNVAALTIEAWIKPSNGNVFVILDVDRQYNLRLHADGSVTCAVVGVARYQTRLRISPRISGRTSPVPTMATRPRSTSMVWRVRTPRVATRSGSTAPLGCRSAPIIIQPDPIGLGPVAYSRSCTRDRGSPRTPSGRPFGTQSSAGKDGVSKMDPVDPPVTDEKLARGNVPSLADQPCRVDARNAAH